MTRICHISPVHHLHDNRILYKQLRSLVEANYDVHYVVQHDRSEKLNGVQLHPLKKPKSRWQRWLSTDWQALFKALAIDAEIYQFHDMEFIPQAIIMRLLGKKVVYDIHEDHSTSLPQKPYLPKPIGKFLGWAIGCLEKAVTVGFSRVIAERCYSNRFPRAVQVLNYPIAVDHKKGKRSDSDLLYAGSVMHDRGAMIHASIPKLVDNVNVHFWGMCPTRLHRQMVAGHPEAASRLKFAKVGQFVPYRDIQEQFQNGKWLAGLAIFPDTINYREKELTKLFEYMQFGLPIIASNFPAWKKIIDSAQCGFCVDASDSEAIANAVRKLRDDPELWQRMSQNGIEAAKQYTWHSQSAKLLKLYRGLLPRGRRPVFLPTNSPARVG